MYFSSACVYTIIISSVLHILYTEYFISNVQHPLHIINVLSLSQSVLLLNTSRSWHPATHLPSKHSFIAILQITIRCPSASCVVDHMYRFELAEQAHFAGPHLVKLHSDSSFRRDACYGALPVFLVKNRSTQTQPPIDPTDDCQDSHQTAHCWSFGVGEVVFKHNLKCRDKVHL